MIYYFISDWYMYHFNLILICIDFTAKHKIKLSNTLLDIMSVILVNASTL